MMTRMDLFKEWEEEQVRGKFTVENNYTRRMKSNNAKKP